MNLTPELKALAVISVATSLMWIPYVVDRVASHGVRKILGSPASRGPDPHPWAQRAHRAHLNAVENLVAFAPLVLISALAGISTPATVLASKVYVLARLAHYAVYVAGIPALRTALFVTGVVAMLVFGEAIWASAKL